MKKYKSYFIEKRLNNYKAWYSPNSNVLFQFSPNGLHSEIAEEKLGLTQQEAIMKGYYRIFVSHEIVIDSIRIPTDREFNALKYKIEEYSYKKFKDVRWNINNQKIYFFPNQSFLFADSIKDGKLKRY